MTHKTSSVLLALHNCTMVENRKKHRHNSHPIIHFPTSEGVSGASEWTSEWPSTYIWVLNGSGPQFIDVELTGDMKWIHGTMVQNNKEARCKYWATRLSVCSFACTAHSFTCSALLAALTSLLACSLRSLPLLWESEWWVVFVFFLLFWTIVHCTGTVSIISIASLASF